MHLSYHKGKSDQIIFRSHLYLQLVEKRSTRVDSRFKDLVLNPKLIILVVGLIFLVEKGSKGSSEISPKNLTCGANLIFRLLYHVIRDELRKNSCISLITCYIFILLQQYPINQIQNPLTQKKIHGCRQRFKYIVGMLSQINGNAYQDAKLSEKKKSQIFHDLGKLTNKGKTFSVEVYSMFNLAPSLNPILLTR